MTLTFPSTCTHKQAIENALQTLNLQGYHPQFVQATLYALTSSGKRLRPLLTLAICDDPLEKALVPAISLELMHTYSLIHDDLPCMDDDDYRRGRPSVHKKFGEDIAVLTGDGLLTLAFQTLADTKLLCPEEKIQMIQLLAEKSGAKGMISGQITDVTSEGKSLSRMQLDEMYAKKTADLITCAVCFGGILASYDAHQLKLLEQFGNHLGIAFQYINDLNEKLKKQNSDVACKKATALTTMHKDDLKIALKQLLLKCKQLISSLPCKKAIEDLLSQIIPIDIYRLSC